MDVLQEIETCLGFAFESLCACWFRLQDSGVQGSGVRIGLGVHSLRLRVWGLKISGSELRRFLTSGWG